MLAERGSLILKMEFHILELGPPAPTHSGVILTMSGPPNTVNTVICNMLSQRHSDILETLIQTSTDFVMADLSCTNEGGNKRTPLKSRPQTQ